MAGGGGVSHRINYEMSTFSNSEILSVVAISISLLSLVWTIVHTIKNDKSKLSIRGFSDWYEDPRYSGEAHYNPEEFFVIEITNKSKKEIWFGTPYLQYHDKRKQYLALNSEGMKSIKPGEQIRNEYPMELILSDNVYVHFDDQNYHIVLEDSFGNRYKSKMVNPA